MATGSDSGHPNIPMTPPNGLFEIQQSDASNNEVMSPFKFFRRKNEKFSCLFQESFKDKLCLFLQLKKYLFLQLKKKLSQMSLFPLFCPVCDETLQLSCIKNYTFA